MRRRSLLAFLSALPVLWPIAGATQSADRVRRIGVLIPTSPQGGAAFLGTVKARLGERGWVEGRNLRLDVRWVTDNDPEGTVGKELLALHPDAILVGGSPVLALHKATQTVPIVFASFSDPIGNGLAASLAHPGANLTGFANIDAPLTGKSLEFLKEIAPPVTHVTVLVGGVNYPDTWRKAAESAARTLGIRVSAAEIHDAASIEDAIGKAAAESNGGLVSLPSGAAGANRQLIVDLAARSRLPAIYPAGRYPALGGLMSYGVDFLALYRHAAEYVDRILRGEKPGDLPIQQPTKFELVINLKTAKALGLTVPPALLARADEVIE